MSHDITRPSEHPTGDGIAQPATPSEDLTNAFNALFVAAYRRIEGGVAKMELMSLLERHADTLTTYAKQDSGNFFTAFNPFALRHIAETAEDPRPYDCQDLALILPEVLALQDLHRDACHECVYPHGGGDCFCCGRTVEDKAERTGGFYGDGFTPCDCRRPELHPHDVICRCGGDDDDDQPRHDRGEWDDRSNGPRLCHCGEEALDQTGDCAPFCSAACADNEPEGWDYTTNADPCPLPCGGHWGGCDECLNGPASSSTDDKFADAEAVWLDRQQDLNGAGWEDREAWKDANPTEWEDFTDGLKSKVTRHINHAINADKMTVSRLVLGWDELNCPNCGGESRLEFHAEGGGCVRVECGGLIPCFDEVLL